MSKQYHDANNFMYEIKKKITIVGAPDFLVQPLSYLSFRFLQELGILDPTQTPIKNPHTCKSVYDEFHYRYIYYRHSTKKTNVY